MITKVLKWGNSLALRIPVAFARELNIEENSQVNITLKEGKLSLEPVKEYETEDLSELLDQVNESNLHYEIDTGKPQGKEIW